MRDRSGAQRAPRKRRVISDPILRLAPDLGFPVRETRLDIGAIVADVDAGRITEAFCMGTAAVVVPIGRIGHHAADDVVGDGVAVPVAQRLYRALTDIQYGRATDPYGWTRVIDADQGQRFQAGLLKDSSHVK